MDATTYKVPIARLSSWLLRSFRPEDYVFIKVDVEGFEYDILLDLLHSGSFNLIDELSVEWHSRFNELSKWEGAEPIFEKMFADAGVKFHSHD